MSSGNKWSNRRVLYLSIAVGVVVSISFSIGLKEKASQKPPVLDPYGVPYPIQGTWPPGSIFQHLEDKPAPDFQVSGYDGKTVTLEDGGNGEPWLLLFTESSCNECDAAYPWLEKATTLMPVVVIGVGERIALHQDLMKLGVTIGYDSLHTARRTYQIRILPTALLIDHNDVVRYGAIGPRSVEMATRAYRHRLKTNDS